MSSEHNPPAFPIPDVRTHDGFGINEGSQGMTLRDWFAGQAIAGSDFMNCSGWSHLELAQDIYSLADAMLAARKGADHVE